MITAAQARVLDALVREYAENGGWPVTVRRLCDLTGLASTANAHEHLRALLAEGKAEQRGRSGFRPAASQGAYTAARRRADYESVTAALRALSDAWCASRPPTQAEGLKAVSDAHISIARLAVAAGVPHELPSATPVMLVIPKRGGDPQSVRVGSGKGPHCDDCGLDLSLSDDQIRYVTENGNPIPRPPCVTRHLHRLIKVP